MSYFSIYPNRSMCEVLEEMRKCYETYNFSPVKALIEEIQIMGNRMEAALNDKKDVKTWTEEREELKKEIKKLRKERDELKPKKA